MKLKTLVIENFRSYKEKTVLNFAALTTIVGENSAGKSTILEALEIFFNNETVKIDQDDSHSGNKTKEARITCIFDELPEAIVLDSDAPTTLKEEELLNADGDLEITRVFDCEKKACTASTFIRAKHRLPLKKKKGSDSIVLLKNAVLKEKATELKLKDVRLNENPSLRQGIRNAGGVEKEAVEVDIPVDKENGKDIFEVLQSHLPLFALFKVDRTSNDKDAEVQDPLMMAVAEAVKAEVAELAKIQERIRAKVEDVAARTKKKLSEMDAGLAKNLKPEFAPPKWESVFKVGLRGEDGIPLNKQGSGFRRLVLLNFFRAEAERSRDEGKRTSIIYAIEEPETSQHPNHQMMLMRAFRQLSQQVGTQVILTTHQPAIAELAPTDGLRFVQPPDNCPGGRILDGPQESVLVKIAETLGIVPDRRVRLVVCLEGPTDVTFWYIISAMLHATDSNVPNLETDKRVAVVAMGGSALKHWVERHYLQNLQLPEAHFYDRDMGAETVTYDEYIQRVNDRSATDGSWGLRTQKREIENYLHPDAIREALGLTVTFTDNCDVPLKVAEQHYTTMPNPQTPWAQMNQSRAAKKMKEPLCSDAAAKMTVALLRQMDPSHELKNWLLRVGDRMRNPFIPPTA